MFYYIQKAGQLIGQDWYRPDNGVSHGDELFLLFKSKVIPMETIYGEGDKKTSHNLLKMWTDFAKTGDPTPNLETLHSGVKWERYIKFL